MYMCIITHTCYTGTPTVGFSYECLFRSDSGQNIAGTFIVGIVQRIAGQPLSLASAY